MKNIDKLLSHQGVLESDLPEIDLYMDQVTSYLEKVLESFKIESEDKILTKTMINNYVKAQVIDKPIKKKYNKTHLMALVIIYHLKNILSINEIKVLLEKGFINSMYNDLLEMQNDITKESVQVLPKDLQLMDDTEKMNLAIKWSLQADLKKRMAEELIKSMAEV